jgi:Ca-activated chloride channel family protein
MHFGFPQLIGPLALAVAVLAVLAVWTFFRDRRDLRELGHRNLVLSPATALARRGLRAFLLLCALTACAFGAARWWGKPIPSESGQYGLDVMLALDVSKSMLSRDVRPNRLEAAKAALLGALGGMEGNRVGFCVFAGDAVVQVPLTLDLEVVGTVLEGADVEAVDYGGTNLAEAILTAVEAFPEEKGKDGEKDKEPPKRGRVLLLYTDGEPTAGEDDLREALRAANDRHVAVACVGVGTQRGQAIPDGQSFWGEAIYKRDSEGRIVVSRLDETTLRKIASATGGLYVAGNTRAALADVQGLLNRLEKSLIQGKGAVRRQELAPWAGLAASILLILAVLW